MELPSDMACNSCPPADVTEEFSFVIPEEQTSSSFSLPESQPTVINDSFLGSKPTSAVPAGSSTGRVMKRKTYNMKTSRAAITSACETRISVHEEQLKIMRAEHEKDMEIKDYKLRILKDYKLRILKEKLKYWEKKNSIEFPN